VRQAFAPLAKSTVRGVYRIGQKSKELIADVQEQIQDIVAEVDAENARA
jgi:DNA-binding PadR family transcriptional regulator